MKACIACAAVAASTLFAHTAADAASPTQIGAAFETFGPHIVTTAAATNADRLARKTIGVSATSNARVVVAEDASIVSSIQVNGDAIGLQVLNDASVIVQASSRSDQIDVKELAIGQAIGMVGRERGLVDFRGQIRVAGDGNGDTRVADFRGSSNLIFSGHAEGRQGGNGRVVGILLADSAHAIATGSVRIVDDGNDGAVGILASDSSTALVTGHLEVEDSGNGNAVGVLASGMGVIDFRGDVVLRESGNGVSVFADVGDSSHVLINGNMQAESSGNESSPGVLVHGAATLDYVGGSLRLDTTLRGPGPQIDLSDESSMTWSGGVLDLQVRGNAMTPLLRLNDTSSLTIIGTDFNRPAGTVDDLAGSLSGMLSDGSPFFVDFERSEHSRIRLVPEPSSSILLVLVAIASLVHRLRPVAAA